MCTKNKNIQYIVPINLFSVTHINKKKNTFSIKFNEIFHRILLTSEDDIKKIGKSFFCYMHLFLASSTSGLRNFFTAIKTSCNPGFDFFNLS